MVVAALRRPRGFIELDVMATLAVVLAVIFATIFACGVFGHLLWERDRANVRASAAERRAETCAVVTEQLVAAGDELQRNVDLHLAIDDDACACWHPEAP